MDGPREFDLQIWDATAGELLSRDLTECVRVLRDGGVVVIPTETVYGLACALTNEAISALLSVKGRTPGKPLPVQIGHVSQAGLVAAIPFNRAARLLSDRFWPGPLTLVVAAGRDLNPAVLGAGNSVGIRVPDHPVALQILNCVGIPLVVTSANVSGQPAPATLEGALCQLGARAIQGAIDGGPSSLRIASTVVDVRHGELTILRQGAISADRIYDVVRPHEAGGLRAPAGMSREN